MWSNLSGVLSPTSLEPTLATLTCGPQKYDPSLRSLLHEPIFMMQAAEYGPPHNPVRSKYPNVAEAVSRAVPDADCRMIL